MNLNRHTFRQMIGSAVGWPAADWPRTGDDFEDDLSHLLAYGKLNSPEPDVTNLSVLAERFSVLKDLNLKRKSILAQCLAERLDETVLVADSILSGKDALFFVKLVPVQSTELIADWVNLMCPGKINLTVKPIDENHQIMAASLVSFVPMMSAE